MFFFFFFHAEDGIRDVAVTGVQTCALPICLTGGGQDNNLLYLSGVPHSKVPSSKIIDKVVKLDRKSVV